jgi:ketosteroid isomerase-like protein
MEAPVINTAFCFIFLSGLLMPLDTQTEEGLEGLIEAELAFARCASEMGVGKAFCTYLTEEAIIFKPEPTKGREWYKNQTDPGISLVWRPIYAEIAASKDFGYTTGPWHLEVKGQKTKHYGHYVSVWKKETTNPWRVIIDVGIPHPKQGDGLTETSAEVASRKNLKGNTKPASMESEIKRLLERERAFSKDAENKGMVKAFTAYAAEDVRLYREGSIPVLGKEKALSLLSKKKGIQSWQPLKAVVSPTGDLGFTYGFLVKVKEEPPQIMRFTYFRIWRKMDSAWMVVLDLTNALPQPK